MRTGAVALVLAAGVTQGSITGSTRRLLHTVIGPANVQLRARGPEGFDESLLAGVERLPGVQSAAPLLERSIRMIGPHGQSANVYVAGTDVSLAVLDGLGAPSTVDHLADLFGCPARLLRAAPRGIDLIAIDAPHLYGRAGNPYAGPDGREWFDNALRFAGLGAVGAYIGAGRLAGFRPAIVHAHDWQAGLAAAYLHYGTAPRPGTVSADRNRSPAPSRSAS